MLSETLNFAVLSFWSIFVIVDPIGAVPTFLAMTRQNTRSERIRMAALASFVACLVLVAFSLGGIRILAPFGVTMPAFEIAGGILLFKVAFDMLQGRQTALKETPEEQAEGVTKEDIAVTPLAVPMLSGPGAITAVVLLGVQTAQAVQHAVIIVNIVLVSFLTFLILWVAAVRSEMFSTITLKIVTRLMGLLLSEIAMQFVLNGIAHVKPIW